MKFSEIIDQAGALIQRKGRITYRALTLEFDLSEEQLDVLKEELLYSHPQVVDDAGRGLVWNGEAQRPAAPATPLSPQPPTLNPQSPSSYTPAHLAERIRAEQAAMESRGSADGERKTITALFADLKGSTALIEGLDPEDARAIIDPALQVMMDAVHRYDGYVAQALGDGIFALFGAPIAHEDHPQRALYAALRMQAEMRQHSDQSRLKGGIPLQMRVGINTGEVVVRSIRKDDLHTDYVPVGHSTNLAARMEQMANPGSIVISEYTRKLTEGYFDLKALGAAEIKGMEEPLNVYEVLGAGPLRTRLQVSARRGLSRFVGRHVEMEQMQQALEQAKEGHGQIVGVMGEPGLGKSRLFYEFKLTSQSGCLLLEAFPVSHGKASPYLPIIELLKTYFQIESTDDERTRRQKIIGQVLELDRSLEGTLPYLFALLGIEEESSSLQQMDAQIRRQRTFEALKQVFLRESLNQPVLLIFEDLHWIDAETQGFLDSMSESVASAKLLLLVNYRPEYRHEWGTKTYYTQLHLAPLGTEEAEELLTFLLGGDATLQGLKPLILEKTEGTPFFIEEVVQTLAEEGALVGERGKYRLETTPTALHISPTVQGVLAARIDRLTADEKTLLQQLAVIGRQFPLSLVKKVVTQPEADLYRVLASLQVKEFLYEQPAFPESEYLFKHALTLDVVYGTVLQNQRKTLHEKTAQAMETLSAYSREDRYSELAHHYTQSGNTEKAIEYLSLAGQQAAQRSANTEAITHLTTALELLTTLPDTLERSRHELPLQITLGASLQATSGFANPGVEQVYTRARELCQQLGETPQTFPALFGLWLFYIFRYDLQTAGDVAEQLLQQAHEMQSADYLTEAHRARGITLVERGEFVAGRQHLEQGVACYDPDQHQSHAFLYSHDPKVASLLYLSWALWFLGYPDQALRQVKASVSWARQRQHPFSLAMALNFASGVALFRGERPVGLQYAEEAIALSTDQGFPFYLAIGMAMRGYALPAPDRHTQGSEQIGEALIAYRDTGTELLVPLWLTFLAEIHGEVGRVEEGVAAVTEGLAIANQIGDRFGEAELYRLKGELTLRRSKVEEEAETCFHKAIEIAQKQKAKSWELRAATSLARLWQSQGNQAEALKLLAPVYNWFTEGFDTADLKDAKVLLVQKQSTSLGIRFASSPAGGRED